MKLPVPPPQSALISPLTILDSPIASESKLDDPTGGIFAARQIQAKRKSLSIKDIEEVGESPGKKVVVEGQDGQEVEGTVFLMSGGGKGPSGKSKAKFKSKLSIAPHQHPA